MKAYSALTKLQRMVDNCSERKTEKEIIERYAKLICKNFKLTEAEQRQYKKISNEFWGSRMGII